MLEFKIGRKCLSLPNGEGREWSNHPTAKKMLKLWFHSNYPFLHSTTSKFIFILSARNTLYMYIYIQRFYIPLLYVLFTLLVKSFRFNIFFNSSDALVYLFYEQAFRFRSPDPTKQVKCRNPRESLWTVSRRFPNSAKVTILPSSHGAPAIRFRNTKSVSQSAPLRSMKMFTTSIDNRTSQWWHHCVLQAVPCTLVTWCILLCKPLIWCIHHYKPVNYYNHHRKASLLLQLIRLPISSPRKSVIITILLLVPIEEICPTIIVV